MENFGRKMKNLGMGIIATGASIMPGFTKESPKTPEREMSSTEVVLQEEIVKHLEALEKYENMDQKMDAEILKKQLQLEAIISSVNSLHEFSDVYDLVKQQIAESAKNYDLSSVDDFARFQADMTKNAFDIRYHSVHSPLLSKKLEAFAKKFDNANFGHQDLQVRTMKRKTESEWVVLICQNLAVEHVKQFESDVVTMNQEKLKNLDLGDQLVAESDDNK